MAQHPGSPVSGGEQGGQDPGRRGFCHHLKVLHEAGLLAREKRGVWVYYRAQTAALASLGLLFGSR